MLPRLDGCFHKSQGCSWGSSNKFLNGTSAAWHLLTV
jgi:hypothetical protein